MSGQPLPQRYYFGSLRMIDKGVRSTFAPWRLVLELVSDVTERGLDWGFVKSMCALWQTEITRRAARRVSVVRDTRSVSPSWAVAAASGRVGGRVKGKVSCERAAMAACSSFSRRSI
jgi:hypothetical protein